MIFSALDNMNGAAFRRRCCFFLVTARASRYNGTYLNNVWSHFTMYDHPHPSVRRWSSVLVFLCLLLAVGGAVHAQPPAPTASSPVEAVIAVERAVVFPTPDRNAEPLTYLYERERVPVLGQSPDALFLLVAVGDLQGWILRVQADLSGDLTAVPVIGDALPPPATLTPWPSTPTMPGVVPTRTPLPTRTPALTGGETGTFNPTPMPDVTGGEALPLLPGVPPPLTITLPEAWETVNLVVPLHTFDDRTHDVPLTIYFGPLRGNVNAFIYLYWGFPNTVEVDWATGEQKYNLWADGVQILRGSLIGETCNLGVYDQQPFFVGGLEGVGAYYQAADCEGENDTAGWFTIVRVYNGTFAFYIAVEPWDARTAQRDTLQAILDSVAFLSPDEAQGDQ
jgi:hypothetical protein